MMQILNPATGEPLRQLPCDSPESIRAKFEKARKEQVNWANVHLQERLSIIQNFKNLLASRKDTLARTLTQEVGKPITQSQNEIQGLLSRIDFFLEATPDLLKDRIVLENSDPAGALTEKITHEPLGVVANISAWNYPYFVGGNVWIPALLTGNAVIYKPSEFSSLTGLKIQALLHEAGIPPEIFTTVIGKGDVGSELLTLPLQGIFFTGSYLTGRKILEVVRPRMMRTQLELGGKDPVYLCEDVNISSAAAAVADGAFYNTGQSCCSVERIYVHEKIYPAFVEAFVSTVKGFKVGDPLDPETYIGPLTREAQISVLERQVVDACQKGAELLVGGHRLKRPGYYFEPTVLVNANESMELMREESFGPIIGIQKVTGDTEAVELMNDTEYGLTAGVYTQDRRRAERILSQVNSGTVYWNCCDRVSPRLPWTGRGHSGIGTTLSTYGIEAFLQLKAWHLRN